MRDFDELEDDQPLGMAAIVSAEYTLARLWSFEWSILAALALLAIVLTSLMTGVVRPVTSGVAVAAILIVAGNGYMRERSHMQSLLEIAETFSEADDEEFPYAAT